MPSLDQKAGSPRGTCLSVVGRDDANVWRPHPTLYKSLDMGHDSLQVTHAVGTEAEPCCAGAADKPMTACKSQKAHVP